MSGNRFQENDGAEDLDLEGAKPDLEVSDDDEEEEGGEEYGGASAEEKKGPTELLDADEERRKAKKAKAKARSKSKCLVRNGKGGLIHLNLIS